MYGSKRQQKFSRLIQQELAEIFRKEGNSLFGGEFVTMTEVRTTPDLGEVRVYLSLEFSKDKEAVLSRITSKGSEIRHLLGNRIRHEVRSVPTLKFFIDEIPGKASRIDEILNNLEIPPAEEEK